MSHIINIPLDLDTCPANTLGEFMRDFMFPPKNDHDVGCYSTFDVRDGCVRMLKPAAKEALKKFIPEPEDDEDWWVDTEEPNGYYFYHEECDITILMVYFWDGDGTLCFGLYQGKPGANSIPFRKVINNDCKKDYVWEDVDLRVGE